jgi:alpha/beta superfamily hydrolase
MSVVGTHKIRANSVLPARRRDIELHTADGLRLVGELALPPERDPVATLVTLHPLPTHGGFMDSHVLKKASYRLPALADIAVLRFNTRGTTSPRGTSEGSFHGARDERLDVAAAVEFADFAQDPELVNRWLLGWSFGADLALMYGNDPSVEGAILLSPALRFSGPEHLRGWADSGKPVLALVPELDDYLRPDEAVQRFAAIPPGQGHRRRGCQTSVGGGELRASCPRRDRGHREPGRRALAEHMGGRGWWGERGEGALSS